METLDDLRKSIDNIDNAIVAMFVERFKVTNKIGHYKAANGLRAKDSERGAIQYQRMDELACQYGLDPGFARSYLSAVIERVVRNHEQISSKA